MSWLIIGDDSLAAFACDTGMEAFGPLHTAWCDGHAVEELREFTETLDEDPRKLHNRGELHDKYIEWKNIE